MAAAIDNATIPGSLRRLPQWVTWNSETREGRPTKVPYSLNGTRASSTNPATWCAFDDVAGHERIGFVFTESDPFVGIDFDAAFDPETGEIQPWAEPWLDMLDGHFLEWSPSGTGFKAFVRGELPRDEKGNVLCRHKTVIPGGRVIRGKTPAIEAYDAGRFFTVTRKPYGEPVTRIGDGQAIINALVAGPLAQPAKERASSSISGSPSFSDSEVLDLAFRAANSERVRALYNGDISAQGGDRSAADLALIGALRFWTQDRAQPDRLFRGSRLFRPKWDERHSGDGRTYGEMTLDEALSGDFERYGGVRVTRGSGGTTTADTTERYKAASEREWPEPPGEAAYLGIVGEIVRAVSPHTEADNVALLVNILAAFGSAVGRGAWVNVGATAHHAHEFFVLVGNTAKGRKGESWSPIRLLMERAAPDWTGRIAGGLASGEGLIEAVRDPVYKMVTRKDGETVEECVDEGVSDKRFFIIEPEFARIPAVSRRDGNTLSPVIRDAWDGNTLRVLTRKNPLTATNPHISIVGHVTGQELIRELDDVSLANGFANRFMFFAVRRSKFLPEPPVFSLELAERIAAPLGVAIDRASRLGAVTKTEGAKALWASMYPELSRERLGLADALAARAEAHVTRLALLYALADKATQIDVPHLQAASELWAYSERTLEYIFGDSVGDPIADTIRHALSAGALSRTEISALFGRNVLSRRIDAALTLLVHHHIALPRREQTDGRASEIWELVR